MHVYSVLQLVDQRVIHQRVTLQNQTRKKKLVMATNAEFPPFEYYDGDEVVGIDAEFAAAIADKLGMDLKIEDMAFDSHYPGCSERKSRYRSSRYDCNRRPCYTG